MSQKRRGLTLVEMTLVIMIMGILAAISMPRISDCVLAARVRAAVSTVQSHVAYARSVAINQGRTVTLLFDNSLARYQSDDVEMPDQPGAPLAIDLRELFDPSIGLVADFDGAGSLSFDAEGLPRVAGAILVQGSVELSAGSARHRIDIHPGLGIATSSTLVAN